MLTEEHASLILSQGVKSLNQVAKSPAGHVITYRVVADDDNVHLISVGPRSCLLKIEALVEQIASKTRLTIPLHKLDASHDKVPFEYVNTSLGTNPETLAEVRPRLSEQQIALVYLQLGVHLREVHDGVQNDWFGLPRSPNEVKKGALPELSALGLPADLPDSAFSWQETFVELLEDRLHELKEKLTPTFSGEEIEAIYTRIHLLLSRAIGSFLFDDAEVPCLTCPLVSLVNEQLVFVKGEGQVGVTFILPFHALERALWGDSALEWAFTLFESSLGELERRALLEGYGRDPFMFKRQRTKRAWYDLYVFSEVCEEGDNTMLVELQKFIDRIEAGVLY
jgi:hypothetical protein